jgi:pimeloyl-ACP methyl ester carboxylesterase
MDLVDLRNKRPTGLLPFVYDGLINCLTLDPPLGLGYKLNETLFLFPYDWTRSNEDSGRKLAGFIQELIAQWNAKYPSELISSVDVVCHSMGGLVTRTAIIYFQAPVERTVYLASPHYGSAKAYFVLKDDVPINLVSDNWLFEKAVSLAVQATTGVNVDNLKRDLRRAAQGLPSVYELLPDQYWFARAQWLVNIDDSPFTCSPPEGPILGGWPATYLGTAFYSLAANGAQRAEVVRAMEFKDNLGGNLPGKVNLVLYSDEIQTRNQIGYDMEFTSVFTPCIVDYGDTTERTAPGDETVPAISGTGPLPAIRSAGSHTELPNSDATCYYIKRFLVESTR